MTSVGATRRNRSIAFWIVGLSYDDQSVALVQAVIRRPDLRRGRSRFLRAHRADRPAVCRRRAAVAGRGGGDVDLPAGVGEADQRAAAEDLGVVRVGEQREGNAGLAVESGIEWVRPLTGRRRRLHGSGAEANCGASQRAARHAVETLSATGRGCRPEGFCPSAGRVVVQKLAAIPASSSPIDQSTPPPVIPRIARLDQT